MSNPNNHQSSQCPDCDFTHKDPGVVLAHAALHRKPEQPDSQAGDEIKELAAILLKFHTELEPHAYLEAAEVYRYAERLAVRRAVEELKDVRPGKDSDFEHLARIIDDRIATLTDEAE